jgi:hypothetical protein
MKNKVITMEEKDGVFEEKEEEIPQVIELDPTKVTFIYGIFYNGQQYLANTTVETNENLVNVSDWIRNNLIKTLVNIELIPQKSEIIMPNSELIN